MAKQKKELTKTKKLKKAIKRALRPRNIGSILVVLATLALVATSILPYIL